MAISLEENSLVSEYKFQLSQVISVLIPDDVASRHSKFLIPCRKSQIGEDEHYLNQKQFVKYNADRRLNNRLAPAAVAKSAD